MSKQNSAARKPTVYKNTRSNTSTKNDYVDITNDGSLEPSRSSSDAPLTPDTVLLDGGKRRKSSAAPSTSSVQAHSTNTNMDIDPPE